MRSLKELLIVPIIVTLLSPIGNAKDTNETYPYHFEPREKQLAQQYAEAIINAIGGNSIYAEMSVTEGGDPKQVRTSDTIRGGDILTRPEFPEQNRQKVTVPHHEDSTQQQSPLANYSLKTILYTASKGESLPDVAKRFYLGVGKAAEFAILNWNSSNSSIGYFDKEGKLVPTLGEGDETDRTLFLRNDGKWVQLKDVVDFSKINSWKRIALELGIPYLEFMKDCSWNATEKPSPDQWIYLEKKDTSKKEEPIKMHPGMTED